jgi:hypothetical protein
VYAKRSCPAGDPCDLLALLHGPHRIGCRLVMILLSQHGWSAATIAELLGCDPRTVRRWVHRYNTHGAHSLADRPPTGPTPARQPTAGRSYPPAPGPAAGLDHPAATPVPGPPAISLHTLHRRVREVAAWRRPRLVAKGDPDRDQVLAALRQAIATLPTGAVVLAEDETHLNLLPRVRATWVVRGTRQRVITPGTNRRRTILARSTFTAAGFSLRSAARRSAPGSPRSVSSCWRLPDGAGGGGGL